MGHACRSTCLTHNSTDTHCACAGQLWAWASQEVKLQLVHRLLDRDAWPTLQLNQDEEAAYHSVANAVTCHTLGAQADGAHEWC